MSDTKSLINQTVPHGVDPKFISDFEQYVSFCAIGGVITNDDGIIRRLTLAEYAEQSGIKYYTMLSWKRNVPGFGERVRQRRDELFSVARETRLFNELYTIALTAKDKRAAVDAAKTLLGHSGKLQLPVQRSEVEVNNGFAEILQQARQHQIQEGEVINEPEQPAGDQQQ